jgi:hypothetical protein
VCGPGVATGMCTGGGAPGAAVCCTAGDQWVAQRSAGAKPSVERAHWMGQSPLGWAEPNGWDGAQREADTPSGRRPPVGVEPPLGWVRSGCVKLV